MKAEFHRIYWSKEFDWKEYSKRYDQYSKSAGNYYEQSSNKLIENSNISNNSLVIDLGCGTGEITRILLRKYPKIKIIANDLSEEALDYYKINFREEIKNNQIKVFKRNAENLAKSMKIKVDVIFISSALWDMELDSLFKSLKKLLKKKGQIIANLPSLTINKNSGVIYEIEKFFKREANIKKLYRRISISDLKKSLKNSKLKIIKEISYQFSLSKKNIERFFEVLKYRYPFIFFPDQISYKKRYFECVKLFNKLLNKIPEEGLNETGKIFIIEN